MLTEAAKISISKESFVAFHEIACETFRGQISKLFSRKDSKILDYVSFFFEQRIVYEYEEICERYRTVACHV